MNFSATKLLPAIKTKTELSSRGGNHYGLSSKIKNQNIFNNLISRNNNNVEISVKKMKAKNILSLLEQRSEAHRERESNRSNMSGSISNLNFLDNSVKSINLNQTTRNDSPSNKLWEG